MLEFLIEFLGEVFIGSWKYPGAGIRWIAFRGKRPYKSLVEDGAVNTLVFVLVVITILVSTLILFTQKEIAVE